MTTASEWVLASHNKGKLAEFADLFAPLSITLHSAGALGLPEPEETGDTFEANALLKAEAACAAANLPALADDSGLSVDALNGAPGIFSARWAGAKKDFASAMARVERELAAKDIAPQGASARFVCVIALARPGEATLLFRGEAQGHLTFPPRGSQGFGYDPIFIPEGHSLTFAEMLKDEKYRLSHRTQAFEQFARWLQHEGALTHQ